MEPTEKERMKMSNNAIMARFPTKSRNLLMVLFLRSSASRTRLEKAAGKAANAVNLAIFQSGSNNRLTSIMAADTRIAISPAQTLVLIFNLKKTNAQAKKAAPRRVPKTYLK